MVDEVAARWAASTSRQLRGLGQAMRFVETTPEFWDKILAINLKGPSPVRTQCCAR